jgi:exonuclease SbcC
VKLSRIIFKPKWQDKDAATRLAAVTADADPELVAALPELTRTDPDPRIRLAALKRLGDYERWRERSTGDGDGDVRRIARSTYMALLCSGAANCPPLARLISELETLSPQELESVATAALNRDLRAAALARVSRPALLAERAGADPDPALRLMALERVNDPLMLQRIAERARKSDKVISRRARERVEAMRIGAGDAGAISTRARLLCERVELLLRNPGSADGAARAAIEQDWESLGADAPAALAARFQGALALLSRIAASADSQPREHKEGTDDVARVAPVAEPSAHPVSTAMIVDLPTEPDTISEAVASRARFDAALAAAAEEARRERDRRSAALGAIESVVSRLESALDAGDTVAAQSAHAELGGLTEVAGKLPGMIEHKLAPLNTRLAELRNWQHWSNQRRRRALCDEIEALATAGLHPDAVATRVHEARAEWQKLDAMEGADKAAPSGGLVRRFFAACQHALKPAQAYFEKRDTVRDAHRSAIEALLARTSPAQTEDADFKTLSALRRELAGALRALDALSPRDRNQYARRIKDAIATVSPRIEQHTSGVEQAKARLIEQAQALSQHAERGAARAARELQQQWTSLGEGIRSTDQKQWREFRAACDRVFAALDAGRKERDTQAAALFGQAQAIVEEAELLSNDTAADAETLMAQRRELESRWRGVAGSEQRLESRWRKALERLTARVAQGAREKRLARYSVALRKYALLRELERGLQSAERLTPRWEAEAAPFAPFDAPLALRWGRACRSEPAVAAAAGSDEAARELLVRLEFGAGLPSPAEDRQRRMDHQVARLSARMRGGTGQAPGRELDELLAAWFGQPPVSDELERRFEQAARAAADTLP